MFRFIFKSFVVCAIFMIILQLVIIAILLITDYNTPSQRRIVDVLYNGSMQYYIISWISKAFGLHTWVISAINACLYGHYWYNGSVNNTTGKVQNENQSDSGSTRN